MHPSIGSFLETCQHQRFLIVGFTPRTGAPAAHLLERHTIPYAISDLTSQQQLTPLLRGLHPDDVFCGPQSPEQLKGITTVLLSPGVSRTIPLVQAAKLKGIPVLSDIDFLYPGFERKNIVAITGTDGKTTTTTLIGELLSTRGKVTVAGNIGWSVFSKAEEIDACDWLVLEVSSFMLEEITRFRADFSVVLNLAQDHIDRYDSPEAYARTKAGLLKHAREKDTFIKNLDDPVIAQWHPPVRIRTFSESGAEADAWFAEGAFHVGNHSYSYDCCGLKGRQNLPNILASLSVAHEAGVDPSAIADTLAAFRGVNHRMQYLGCFRGVDVYEDSKAANVHAVAAALTNFEHNVVLILGGRDKGLDFTPLLSHAHRIRLLVCYGESGEAIRECLGFDGALYAYHFEDAVRIATANCRRGDVLLLSPGCTSWDQFPNYEVRGDVFQRLVPKVFL